MSDRLTKLNALLRDEAAHAIREEFDFEPGIIVTVVGADVSPTLEHATIKISVYPAEKSEQVLKEIGGRIYDIQKILNSHLNLRVVPKIRFELDTSEEYAEKIENLLQKVSSK